MQDKLIDDILVAVKKTLKEKRDEVENSLRCTVPEYRYLVTFNGIPSLFRAEATQTYNPEAIIATLTRCCNEWANEYEKVKNEEKTYKVPEFKYLAKDGTIMTVMPYTQENAQGIINELAADLMSFAEAYKKLNEEKKTKVYNIASYFTKEGEHTRHIENQEIDVQKELTQLVNAANHFRQIWQNELRAATNWEKQCEKLKADLKTLEENTLLRRKELALKLSSFSDQLSEFADDVY